MNKSIGIGIAAACLGLAGCTVNVPGGSWGKTVKGTGTSRTETFQLDEFSKIDVGGVMTVNVEVGPEQSVKVEADEAVFDILTTESQNGTLQLGMEGNCDTKIETVVTITVPKLDGAEVSGVVNLTAKDIDSSTFNFGASGASKATLEGTVTELDVELSGAGKINLSALTAENLTLDVSGAGKVELPTGVQDAKFDLSGACSITGGEIVNLEVDSSGASKVDVQVTGDVRAEASGASTINVGPNANVVREDMSGASKLKQN